MDDDGYEIFSAPLPFLHAQSVIHLREQLIKGNNIPSKKRKEKGMNITSFACVQI